MKRKWTHSDNIPLAFRAKEEQELAQVVDETGDLVMQF